MVNKALPRVEGTLGAVRSMENVLQAPILPPPSAGLSKDAQRHWKAIIRARARDEWGLVELNLAAQLARDMADIERERKFLDDEGAIIPRPDGSFITNPRASLINTITMRQLKLLGTLRIAGAVVGDPLTIDMPKRRAEREAETTINRLRDESSGSGEAPLLAL